MALNEVNTDRIESRPETASQATGAPATNRPAPSSAKKLHPREARQDRYAHAFSQIVAVMLRDANFRNLRLAQLEWLVIPPVMAGQWRLAQLKPEQVAIKDNGSRESNIVVPVAAALWANVSQEIDKRLSEGLDKPLLLRPNEWVSGDIPWLVAVAGDRRAIPSFLMALQEFGVQRSGRESTWTWSRHRSRHKDAGGAGTVPELTSWRATIGALAPGHDAGRLRRRTCVAGRMQQQRAGASCVLTWSQHNVAGQQINRLRGTLPSAGTAPSRFRSPLPFNVFRSGAAITFPSIFNFVGLLSEFGCCRLSKLRAEKYKVFQSFVLSDHGLVIAGPSSHLRIGTCR